MANSMFYILLASSVLTTLIVGTYFLRTSHIMQPYDAGQIFPMFFGSHSTIFNGNATTADAVYLNNPKVNLSRHDDGSLLSKVPREKYLHNFQEAVGADEDVFNVYNFSFSIPGKNICGGDSPFLVLLIVSKVSDFELRAAIRSTWLNAAEYNGWPSYEITKRIVHAFILADSSSFSKDNDVRNVLLRESRDFNDIILADMEKSKFDDSRNILAGFNWAMVNCNMTKYVSKVDQETMVNIPQLIALLEEVEDLAETNTIVGRINNMTSVSRSGKTAVTKDVYPFKNYPLYMDKSAYVLSSSAVSQLLSAAVSLPEIPSVDPFVTGIVAKKAKLSRYTSVSFGSPSQGKRKNVLSNCEIVWGQKVTAGPIVEPEHLWSLWSAMQQRTCQPDIDLRFPLEE